MGIFTKNKEKMDILQKTQENLELTQKNLSLLAAQNQESISENQEVLQRTLTSIEAMLGKKIESVSCKKEYSDEEKKRAAYALNCCTISVSQIVDYDDIYVLEQEYEAILNNLNLENMPKDEALLDIYKQLLDTITFFRIQEGDKAMLEKEYQDKVKNAIWSAVPSISLAGLATNPIGAAINLATQVGIGYMNYRREKAAIQSEQEKQKWQLTRSAMEQFNGLRRELFTTAWRLADEYKFADNLRITEQQIAIFNKILLETDDLKRYERLKYIEGSFKAYTPFWYHLGNAAYKASQNMCEEGAAEYRKIARDSYEDYIEKTKDAKLNLFRQDHIRAACALELFELNGKRECDTYLLDMAKDAAVNNFDVLEICAMSYLQVGEAKKAKEMLRMLVNEDYNATVNGQILSSIYVSEYIKDPDGSAPHNYETLSDRVNSAYLFPMPDAPSSEQAEILTAQFLKKQKVCLLKGFNSVLKELMEEYTLKFNQCIPTGNQETVDTRWYFSDDPDANNHRIKDIKRVFSQNHKDQYVQSLGFAVSNILDVLNELCVIMEEFPYSNGDMFAYCIKAEVTSQKTNLEDILNKVASVGFTTEDIPLLFKVSFSDLTRPAFLMLVNEIRSTIKSFSKMEDISIAETLLRRFCVQKGLTVPVLVVDEETNVASSYRKPKYISLNMLDMEQKDLEEKINCVREMKEIISNLMQNKQLVNPSGKDKMIVLTDKDAKFDLYRSNYLSNNSNYFGDPLLIICHEKAKNSVDDLVFTSKGIVHFERGKIKYKEWPHQLYIYPPVKYGSIKNKNDGIHIGSHVVEYDSNTYKTESLYEMICALREKQALTNGHCGENDSKTVIRSNLADDIESELLKALFDDKEVNKEQRDMSEKIPREGKENAVSPISQENGCIRLNKVLNEKDSNGDWVIEGTVISGNVKATLFCNVQDMGEYHVRGIHQLDDIQSIQEASEGQTARFRLKKRS